VRMKACRRGAMREVWFFHSGAHLWFRVSLSARGVFCTMRYPIQQSCKIARQ
jgi:hypothetical protein